MWKISHFTPKFHSLLYFVWGRNIVENLYSKFTTHFVLVAFHKNCPILFATEKAPFVHLSLILLSPMWKRIFLIHSFLFLKWSLWDNRNERTRHTYLVVVRFSKPFIVSCGVVIANKASNWKIKSMLLWVQRRYQK